MFSLTLRRIAPHPHILGPLLQVVPLSVNSWHNCRLYTNTSPSPSALGGSRFTDFRNHISRNASTSTPSNSSETQPIEQNPPSPAEGQRNGNAPSSEEISAAEVVEELRKAMDELESQLKATDDNCKELQDKLLRALAENENARVRYRKEVENAKAFGITKFADSILEVADNLQRAIDSASPGNGSLDSGAAVDSSALLEGVVITQTVLNNCLSNYDIKPFDAMGQQFDPKLHEALFEMNGTDKPKGTVVQIIKQGYMIKDRVLRPAKVGTSKGS